MPVSSFFHPHPIVNAMPNTSTPHDESARDELREERVAEAATDLHAATRAVLLLLGHPEAFQAECAYAAPVFDRLEEADAAELQAYEEEVEERAQQLADVLDKAPHAVTVQRLGQAARQASGLLPAKPEVTPSEAVWALLPDRGLLASRLADLPQGLGVRGGVEDIGELPDPMLHLSW